VLQALIEGEGLHLRHVPAGPRNGAYVHDRREGSREVIVETSAFPLRRHDLDALYSATLAAAIEAGTCVLTGTTHEVVPRDAFRRLAGDLGRNGVDVVADLSGPSLGAALEGGVALVKLSHAEVIRDGYATRDDVDELVEAIGKLQSAGARDVVISRGSEPAVACLDGRLLQAVAPEFEVIDPHGTGDAMTATLAVARARRLAPDDMLRLGVAAGSLNATRHGLATGTREDVERMAHDISVRSLQTPAHPDGVCR
jgi:1-phosphofructokinase